MELNRNDRRGDYTLPSDDSNEVRSEKIFISKRKLICFAITFVVLMILSAVIGTVVSLNKDSPTVETESIRVTNRSRKTAGGNENTGHQPWNRHRLPRNIIPLQYWITQRINISDTVFHGQVRVKVFVKSDTDTVMLHTDPKRIQYTSIRLQSNRRKQIKFKSAHHYNEYLVIVVEKTLQKGHSYILTIKYNTPFETYPQKGLYKVYNRKVYDFESKKWKAPKSMAVTLFFPVAARKSFPCFDEPDMKALFTLTLMYNRGYQALSNMQLRRRTVTPTMFIDSFDTSPKMSTYLLNYVISDYTSNETTTVNGTRVQVWSPPKTPKSRQFALAASNVILPYYESLFGIKYPLPKLDMITVPEFKYGAMEHWGLITYAQSRLLIAGNRPSAFLMKKQSITFIIAHEIVHQWVGNLVTLKWWNDVIIHEGVASYFQYFGAAKFLPDFNIMEQFYNIEVRLAMKEDSFESAKCITQSVSSTDEADRNVVSLVYDKGAAILRMLHAYIGDGPFMNGFRLYLKKFAYGNADREDLWSCISETSNIEVSSIMESWTSQPGFPIITASELQNDKVTLSQRRFLTGKHLQGQFGNETWRIPITYVTSEDPKRLRHYLLTSPNSTMNIKSDWFKLNADASGYYIVNYDIKNWNRITKQLCENHTIFSSLDRASIIKDSFTLAEEGLLSITVALNATKYLQKERDWIPWQYAKHSLSEMIVRLPERSSLRRKIIKYVRKLSKPILEAIGWEEKLTLREQMLQETAISAALNAGDKQAIKINNKIFQAWIHNQTYIPDNIAKVVYFYGILNGNEQDWQILYHRYGQEWRDDQRAVLLSALGASKDPWILSSLLKMATRTRYISAANTVKAIADGSRLGRSIAWNFMKANWNQLPYASNVPYAVDTYVAPVVDKFSSSFQYNDVYKFLKSKFSQGKLSESAVTLLNTIKRNVERLEKEAKNIEFWFDNYNKQNNQICN